MARYNKGKLFVSTLRAFDTNRYETAVAYPFYNNGKIIIVEEYDSYFSASKGHEKWVKTMTSKKLPKTLVDVSTCGIAQLFKALRGGKNIEYKMEIS